MVYGPILFARSSKIGLRARLNPRSCILFLYVQTASRRVFVIIVQYGCNPTGMTATTERRKEVLRLAREHSFIILEGKFPCCKVTCDSVGADDPYFYLYYGDSPRYPSYFSLEREEPEVGRVLRFDSLSKVLSAGMRIGFVSGPIALLDAIDRHVSPLITLGERKHADQHATSDTILFCLDCDLEPSNIIAHTSHCIFVVRTLGL